MTNSIKISPQRTSFILSVSVILYWATDSYLYLSCHINLMEYSTPVILYITAMILACGVLQRFFFRFITKNELSLKSATKLFSVLLASKRPLITELADKLRLKYPLLPTISPCPTMRLEAIRSIIPISCRRYPKSV
ncbi:hypothetical protein F9949_16630 [Bacteroides stercoris]|nr:hypothetical protein F9949_16630 [Bacteroides stercoris]